MRGPSGLAVGETVTVESFEPGEAVKVSGLSVGKGFQGTIKRHGFTRGPVTHGSHNVRAPGSIGASAYPSRVFKGMRMAGRMGGTRVTQPGLVVHEVDTERNLLLIRGSVPGPKSGHRGDQERALMAAPKAPVLGGGKAKEVSLEAVGLRGRREAAPRPRDRARGDERGAGRNSRREEPRARRRRPREAVAPEGHGPRSRRDDPRAALDGRRRRVRADDAQLRGEGEPQGTPCRAARRAQLARGQRDVRARER